MPDKFPFFAWFESTNHYRQAHREAARELDKRATVPESDPNHPMYELHIFGEHHATFMQRQHKAAE